MSFQEFSLHPDILAAIADLEFESPTPIQQQAIPKILEGLDLQASAQTGTGKTMAFIAPALNRMTVPSPIKGIGPRVLILVPTRELAMQVAAEANKLSKHLSRVTTLCIYGGAPYPVQNRQLSRHHEILVATPGRLLDHIERGRINFSRLEMLILDEADRMLDMGFIEPVEHIASLTPPNRQTLLFSATLGKNVMHLSKSLLRNPIEISVSPSHAKHELIEQRIMYVDNIEHKHKLLDHLLQDDTISQAIVFTSTKINADQLVDTLYEQGHQAAALHGDMNQRQRTRTISQMRSGKVRILVATDVAARGIDVQSISHVINFDLPNNADDYVHRIGRTGRAGAKGKAFSFVAGRDFQLVKRIEQFTKQQIEVYTIPGMEPKSKPGQQKMPRRPKKHKRPANGQGRPANGFGRPANGQGRPANGQGKNRFRGARRP